MRKILESSPALFLRIANVKIALNAYECIPQIKMYLPGPKIMPGLQLLRSCSRANALVLSPALRLVLTVIQIDGIFIN